MSNPYPYGYETWGEKFSRKVKENPWVPAGCLATTGALIMSAVKMRSGESKHMNYWMRARVGLQGLTLVALVAGTLALRAEREKAQALENAAAVAATGMDLETLQKAKEKEEFEARLRGAEEATEEERGLKGRVVRGPTVVKHERHAEGGPVTPAAPKVVSGEAATGESGSKKSWWRIW